MIREVLTMCSDILPVEESISREETPFDRQITKLDGCLWKAEEIATLQVNVGYRCNMACWHCHVKAASDRSTTMDRETVDAVLKVLEDASINTLDITGGAPELNPHFRYFIESARRLRRHVMVRTNLTVFFEEGMDDLPMFCAEHGVELIASLPCYTRENVDAARGNGAFEKSIRALHKLNEIGYVSGDGGLMLNLVYNPGGAFFPTSQEVLEKDYRTHLTKEHGVFFHRLYALANIPLGGFRNFLINTGSLDHYMRDAREAFNPGAVPGLMCRHLINVGPDGSLYDCDFNHIAGRPVTGNCPKNIRDFDKAALIHRSVAFQEYCWICTAGGGSTCFGTPRISTGPDRAEDIYG